MNTQRDEAAIDAAIEHLEDLLAARRAVKQGAPIMRRIGQEVGHNLIAHAASNVVYLVRVRS